MVVPPPNVNGNMNGSAGANVAGGGPFKPVPPPKPKNYRPPLQNSGNGNGQNQWENQVSCMVCCVYRDITKQGFRECKFEYLTKRVFFDKQV